MTEEELRLAEQILVGGALSDVDLPEEAGDIEPEALDQDLEDEFELIGDAPVPKVKPKVVGKEKDGSYLFDDGSRFVPTTGMLYQGAKGPNGETFVVKPDGKLYASKSPGTAKDKIHMIGPRGAAKPHVYKDGKMVEVPVESSSGKPSVDKGTEYAAERTSRVIQSVDELEKRVDRSTVGFGGVILKNIPETNARNFAAELDTLKANIAFGELAEMRNASKTGGALGAVSNVELGLLQSTLGALDIGQSPENLKKQLAKIRNSIKRWEEAKKAYADEAAPLPTPPAAPSATPSAPPSPTPSPDGKDEHGYIPGRKYPGAGGKVLLYKGNDEWVTLP